MYQIEISFFSSRVRLEIAREVMGQKVKMKAGRCCPVGGFEGGSDYPGFFGVIYEVIP
jgi:hypothetical protein